MHPIAKLSLLALCYIEGCDGILINSLSCLRKCTAMNDERKKQLYPISVSAMRRVDSGSECGEGALTHRLTE